MRYFHLEVTEITKFEEKKKHKILQRLQQKYSYYVRLLVNIHFI